VAPCATGATFEAATVEIAVAVSAVVAAERWATSRRTLSIGGAGATKGDIATASTGAYGATNTISAIQSATAVGASGATTALISAAVERAITGNCIVFAEDRSASLAALTRRGALPTKSNRAATATRGAADSIAAAETTAADSVPITRSAIIVTTVEYAVSIDTV
jgi:hypothetical protein